MSATVPSVPSAGSPLGRRLALRADLYGLVGLVGSGLLLIAIGAGWVDGVLATLALALLLVIIVALVGIAVLGGPEARRVLAPYGLLKPGTLWLALFYLAPLWTLLRISLSAKESRFSVDYQFSWEFSNYVDAFRDFGAQFTRAFVYAGVATLLTIAIGYPLAYVIAFRGGRFKTVLLGLVVVPFFTSYLIRTIAWSSILADSGIVVGTLERLRLVGLLESLNIMDNGRLLNTPAAVIGAGMCVALASQIAAGVAVILNRAKPLAGRDYLVVGLPVMLGTLVSTVPTPFFASLPPAAAMIVSNGLVLGIIMVLALEHGWKRLS